MACYERPLRAGSSPCREVVHVDIRSFTAASRSLRTCRFPIIQCSASATLAKPDCYPEEKKMTFAEYREPRHSASRLRLARSSMPRYPELFATWKIYVLHSIPDRLRRQALDGSDVLSVDLDYHPCVWLMAGVSVERPEDRIGSVAVRHADIVGHRPHASPLAGRHCTSGCGQHDVRL